MYRSNLKAVANLPVPGIICGSQKILLNIMCKCAGKSVQEACSACSSSANRAKPL